MADMLAATLTLPDAPVVRPGVTLAMAPPARRLSLRGRDAEALGRAVGLTLPMRIGDWRDGVAMLGPDEWLALLDPAPLRDVAARRADGGAGPNRAAATIQPPFPGSRREALAAQGKDSAPVSIVDVSSRAIGFWVSGPGAADLLGAGCPLDLARMAPGRATRTLSETVEIILIRETDERFHVDVWRSFAPWLFAALAAAAPAVSLHEPPLARRDGC